MKYKDLLIPEPKSDEEINELILILQNNHSCTKPECYCKICTAREEIILSHMRLIWWIARKYTMGYIDPEELMADGIIELHNILDSLDKFTVDPNKGTFGNYIIKSIEFAIRSSDIRNKSVRLPNRQITISRILPAVQRDLAERGNLDPSNRELAVEVIRLDQREIGNSTTLLTKEEIIKHINVTERRIKDYKNNPNQQSSYHWDDLITADTRLTFADVIGNIDRRYNEIEEQDLLEKIFDHLDPDEQKIIGHSFGFTVNNYKYEILDRNKIIQTLDEPIKVATLTVKKRRTIKKIYRIIKEENLDIVPDWLEQRFEEIEDSKIGLNFSTVKFEQWIYKNYPVIKDLATDLCVTGPRIYDFRKKGRMSEKSRKNWIRKLGFDPIEKFQ